MEKKKMNGEGKDEWRRKGLMKKGRKNDWRRAG